MGKLKLRHPHNGLCSTLPEVIFLSLAQLARRQRAPHLEGLLVLLRTVPRELRRTPWGIGSIVHLPHVHTLRGYDSGGFAIVHPYRVVGRGAGMIAANDGKGVRVVRLVGVGRIFRPHPQCVGGVVQSLGRQLQHHTGMHRVDTFGSDSSRDWRLMLLAAVHLVVNRQPRARIGLDTAVADHKHQLRLLRHIAGLRLRIHHCLRLEVVAQRRKLEGSRTGGGFATQRIVDVGGHRSNGNTHSVNQAVEGAQVYQRAVQEVGGRGY